MLTSSPLPVYPPHPFFRVHETEVDRFSPRQAFILIAATNRPDDLHPSLLQPGRVDREVRITLPSEEQRVKIFDVHCRGRRVAADLDFAKVREKGAPQQ